MKILGYISLDSFRGENGRHGESSGVFFKFYEAVAKVVQEFKKKKQQVYCLWRSQLLHVKIHDLF